MRIGPLHSPSRAGPPPAGSLASDLARSFRRLALVGALLVLVALGYFAATELYFNPQGDLYTAGRQSLALAHGGMLDQQTGITGFLSSRDSAFDDPVFLEPFDRGRAEVARGDTGLAALARGDSRLAPAIDDLLAAQGRWMLAWVREALTPAGRASELTVPRGDQLFNLYRTARDRLSAAIDERLGNSALASARALQTTVAIEVLLSAFLALVWVRERRRLRESVVRPVQQLLAAIEALGTGEGPGVGAVEGPAEISTIVEALASTSTMLALKERARELERANRELEQFSYLASHDLQEPLRMVVSHVQLLARRCRGRVDGEVDEYIDFIVSEAGRMQSLMGALLVYSRAGRGSAGPHSVSAGDCVSAAAERLASAIADSGAIVHAEGLPRLTVAPDQLTQLFEHLLSNSIIFRGGAPPRIQVSAEGHDGMALISVRDNGIGIPAHQTERVFLVFQRLHGRGEYSDGPGIGLAICKRIVEQYGGRIWVDAGGGRGTTVRFTLPLAEGAAEADLAPADPSAAPPPAGRGPGVRRGGPLRRVVARGRHDAAAGGAHPVPVETMAPDP